jgi:NTE family protein
MEATSTRVHGSEAEPTGETGRAAAATGGEGLPKEYGQVVLVLQGGGALGAYQLGIYEALHEARVEPDWVIGTSIGAINASLIAGNPFDQRLERVAEFWARMRHGALARQMVAMSGSHPAATSLMTIATGIPAFFTPNLMAFTGAHTRLGPGAAGYYSTAPLAETLNELVDFGRINAGETRLTVGAANVRTSAMTYFDSRKSPLDVRHVLASGALPPAFPAVEIDGEYYWDGGVLSNTPVEAVFDDNPRKNAIVFVVHIWNPEGPPPETMWQVMNRQKDVQYSSRAASHIARQRQIHRMRHIIAELAQRLPDDERLSPEVRALAGYGCVTRMHVVRLLAPSLDGEDHTKDIDFSTSGIGRRRATGYADMCRVLEARPWEADFDPLEGFILHEARPDGVHSSVGTAS